MDLFFCTVDFLHLCLWQDGSNKVSVTGKEFMFNAFPDCITRIQADKNLKYWSTGDMVKLCRKGLGFFVWVFFFLFVVFGFVLFCFYLHELLWSKLIVYFFEKFVFHCSFLVTRKRLWGCRYISFWQWLDAYLKI